LGVKEYAVHTRSLLVKMSNGKVLEDIGLDNDMASPFRSMVSDERLISGVGKGEENTSSDLGVSVDSVSAS
jgi:hypothetical protein